MIRKRMQTDRLADRHADQGASQTIARPSNDEFAELGWTAEFRDFWTAAAPFAQAAVGMAATAWLCVGGGVQIIAGYAEWFGTAIVPGSEPILWDLGGVVLCGAAYVKLCILNVKPSPQDKPDATP